MTELDAWRRKIMNRLENANIRTLMIVYSFIVGLEMRDMRLNK